MKKQIFLLTIISVFCSAVYPQEQQIIRLSPKQIESLFIEQNLHLIAGRMNIDLAEASVIQAKLWENPALSIGDISFWSTASQRDGEQEVMPPLFGSFGKNTQFSVELSQLIQTAGKRRKLVRQEMVSKEIAIQEFEDLLRNLKIELRTSVHEICYIQSYNKILVVQTGSLSRLIAAYNRQAAQGNFSIHELLRLQSALLELENEKHEIQTELNALQKNLKALLGAEPFVYIEIEKEDIPAKNPEEIPLAKLIDLATEIRPDIKMADLQVQFQEKALDYEKALRVPDLTISANYDRWGGVWKNFTGVGISMALPVFNRNQGNIKAARISGEQSRILAQHQQNTALYEVSEAYGNYVLAYDFYKKTTDLTIFSKLDDMLDIYSKNLLNKNISMLEYIDFMDSYKANKEILLSAYKKVNNRFEELQYAVGREL